MTHRILRTSVALSIGVVAWIASSGLAATVDKSVNISSGSTTSSMSLSGTLSVSGQNMKVTLTAGSILGTPVSTSANINLPTQTQAINLVPNPTNINNPTTGNFVLRGEDNYVAVGPDPNDGGDYQLVPGADGKFDDGNSANSAMDLIVQSLNLGLINQNFQTNNVTLNGTASLNILNLATVNLPLHINGAASGNLAVNVNSTGPSNEVVGAQDNSTFPDGAHPYINPSNPLVNAAPDGVDNLGVSGLFFMAADIAGQLQAALNGNITVDLGIFGSINQNLSNLVSFNQLLNQAFAILGQLTAKQIPTPSLLHDNLQATIAYDFGDLGLGDLFNIPVSLVDSQVFNVDFDAPVDILGLTYTLDGDFTGTIHYNLNANASLAPPAYTATGNVVGAINVPEANIMVLLGLTGLAGLIVRYRRLHAA